MTTPRLMLPEIAENQANKYLSHNTALRALDALVQPVAISIANSPSSSSEGDVFIVGQSPTGDFAGQANNIAVRSGGVWRFYTPSAGWRFGVQGTTDIFVFNGSVWSGIGLSGVSSVLFNLLASPPSPQTEGRVFYNSARKTLTVQSEIAGTSLDVGQEQWVRVRNQTGSTIANGTPVYITGASGGLPTIEPASAVSLSSSRTIGIMTHSIPNASEGYACVSGVAHDLDTNAYAVGDLLYLSATTGQMTNVRPAAPNTSVLIGVVLEKSATVGKVYIDVHYTSANRLHDKRTIASATAAGNAGDIAFDDNYLYICTNTNTWRRVALSAW